MKLYIQNKVLTYPSYIITQTFEAHKLHSKYSVGVDIVPCDTGFHYIPCEIRAHSDGKILYSGDGDGYGNAIWIEHGDNLVTGYGHMTKLYLPAGATVKAGTVIGKIGSTGNSTGIHLHFELRKYKTSYTMPSRADFWSEDSFMNKSKFEWVDSTIYLNHDLPIINQNSQAASPKFYNHIIYGDIEKYKSNTIENRFRVRSIGEQIGAFTSIENAINLAKEKDGVVIDSLNLPTQ